MKALILAAGKGRRMKGLTVRVPKPLLTVGGKTLLDHIFDALPNEVNEVIVVIGYQGNLIRTHLGDVYKGRTIHYVVQKALNGTAKAVLLAKPHLENEKRFFIIYGDELPTKREMAECLSHPYSWLCHFITTPISTGVAKLSKRSRIVEVVERRRPPKPPFVSVGGVMLVGKELFAFRPWKHKNGEYYLTSMLEQFLKTYSVYAVMGKTDLYFTNREDIDKFNRSYIVS